MVRVIGPSELRWRIWVTGVQHLILRGYATKFDSDSDSASANRRGGNSCFEEKRAELSPEGGTQRLVGAGRPEQAQGTNDRDLANDGKAIDDKRDTRTEDGGPD